DRAMVGIVKARNEYDQSGFAAAVFAYERDGFPEANLEMNIGKDRSAGLIGEADALKLNGFRVPVQARAADVGTNAGLAIDVVENTVRCRGAGLNSRKYAGKLAHGVGNRHQVAVQLEQ